MKNLTAGQFSWPRALFAVSILVSPAVTAQTIGYTSGDQLLAFDPTSGTILNTFNFDSRQIAVSRDQSTLYLSNELNNSLQLVSAQTGLVISTVTGFRNPPTKVVLSVNGAYAYVLGNAGGQTGTVGIVNLETLAIVATIGVPGGYAYDIALSPNGKTLFVSTANAARATGEPPLQPAAGPYCTTIPGICAFDTKTFALTGHVSGVYGSLSVGRDGNSLYVAPLQTGRVYVVNTASLAVSGIGLPQTFEASQVVASPVANIALIVPLYNQKLSGYVLNTSTNKIVEAFSMPAGLAGTIAGGSAFTPDGSSVWTVTTCFPVGPGCTQSQEVLLGQSFPSGAVIAQTIIPSGSVAVAFPR